MSTNSAAAGAATVTQDLTSQEGAPAERDSELDRWASLSQPVAVDGDAPVEAMVSTPPPPVQNTPRQAQRARRQKIVLAGVCGFGCLVFALAAVRTAAHRADARYAAVTSQGPAATAAQLAPPASIAAGATAATSASGNTSSVALAEPSLRAP